MKLQFSDFLIEAEISDDDLSRLIKAFERRMPKLLGDQLYRYGGKDGVEDLPGGAKGYLYFMGNHKAARLRAKAGHLLGIDLWDHFGPDLGPVNTIQLGNLNSSTILGAFKQIAELIKNPAKGEVKVKGITEALHLDEMASRVSMDDFYRMMVAAYGKTAASNVTWEQIKKVADDNDVQIPAYIRSQKVGRGRWDSAPNMTVDVGDEPPEEAVNVPSKSREVAVAPSGNEPIMYIKVTAQDPASKRFIPAANNEAAQALYRKINAVVNGNPTEEEIRDPDTLYGHLSQLVEMACKGNLRSLLIYGGPGTGKTYTIMQTINSNGLIKGKDYQKLSGKASPIKIYETLFMYRDKGLVVFDDLDSMWGNEDATNILKAALDTSPAREISWVSNQTINVSKMSDERKQDLFSQIDRAINGETAVVVEPDDEEDDQDLTPRQIKARDKAREKAAGSSVPDKIKFPSSFDFTGRVIFISNLKKEEFDSAILSRSAKINMDLTPAEILMRMKKILPDLGGQDVALKTKQELLDELVKQHGQGLFDAVTMREFTKGLDIVRSGAPNWRELLQYS